MTSGQEKPSNKTGIAIQSSAPLYSKRQYGNRKQSKSEDNNFESNVVLKEQIPIIQDHFTEKNHNYTQYQSTNTQQVHEHHNHNHSQANHTLHEHNVHEHHDHHGHDHSQHNHHGHNHGHDHSHQAHHEHDHSLHDHSHHDHSHHGHSHHEHNHHEHSHHDHNHHDHSHHDHGHHGHQHSHNFAPVYTEPLPSWFQVFSRLAPEQKTIFTWFLIHGGIGIWIYCMGANRESLCLIGFGYLMLFDALGVLNSFVSSFIRSMPAFGISNTKRPFGAHRYEVVFALGTTIYLMFATMHNTKESLEHFLLEGHHGSGESEEHHLELSVGMFLLMGLAITAVCLSSIALRNHDNFVRFLRKRPTTVHGFSYNVINRARGNPIHALLSNIYSSSIVLCGVLILLMYMFGIMTPFIDKAFALFESGVMFYLGYPTAKALAKILLQTTPKSVQNGVENRLREILQDQSILHVDRVHFWQTTYGKCVGTIDIQIHPEADEQAVLQLVYQKLEGLTSSSNSSHLSYDDENNSELTVSIFK